MKRRELLGTGAVALLGMGGITAIATTAGDPLGRTPVGHDWDKSFPYDDLETIDTFAIGEPTDEFNPCGATVRNADTAPRRIAIRVVDTVRDEVLFDRSYTLAGGEQVSGELRTYTDYQIRVGLPNQSSLGGSEHVEAVSHSAFDTCNEYGTTATVWSTRSITSKFVSTTAGCGENVEANLPTPDDES